MQIYYIGIVGGILAGLIGLSASIDALYNFNHSRKVRAVALLAFGTTMMAASILAIVFIVNRLGTMNL